MDRHIKEVLGQYLKKSKISNGYKSEKLSQIWANKMGPNISHQTKYIKLYDHVLSIKVESSVLKHELFQNKRGIATMLNEALGDEVIKEVRFL